MTRHLEMHKLLMHQDACFFTHHHYYCHGHATFVHPRLLWLGMFCSETVHHSAIITINLGAWQKQIWLLL